MTEEKEEQDSYKNYHQWFSIILQVLVSQTLDILTLFKCAEMDIKLNCFYVFQGTATYDLSFIDVEVGWPGRASDGYVYRSSQLHKAIGKLLSDPACTLTNSYHIVGDSAYPIGKYLQTPYKEQQNNLLDNVRLNYNRGLSCKRQVRLHFNQFHKLAFTVYFFCSNN